jgi:hypothetical protein
MELTIKNDPRDLRILEYGLSKMDVRTTRSHLLGKMTFAVGGPVLAVKDVDLRADPVDFDLLRTFAGGPFPYDWQGTISGTVRGRGGPLNRWQLDDARIRFDDKHVPGAYTEARARGGLDILFPAFTKFRGLAVDVAHFDLRTPQAINPNFPRVGGIVAGHAVLDSSWLDVRFRDADLTHTDGPAPPSRVLGAGRVTLESKFMRYDLDLRTEPLSLTALARSYPGLPLPTAAYDGSNASTRPSNDSVPATPASVVCTRRLSIVPASRSGPETTPRSGSPGYDRASAVSDSGSVRRSRS